MTTVIGERYAAGNYKKAGDLLRRASVENVDLNQLKPTVIPLLKDSYIGIGCGDTRDVLGELLLETGENFIDVGIKRAYLPIVIFGIELPAFESVFKLQGLMNDEGAVFAQSASEVDSLVVRIHENAVEELFGLQAGTDETQLSIPGDEEAIGIFASKCLSALGRRIPPVLARCA